MTRISMALMVGLTATLLLPGAPVLAQNAQITEWTVPWPDSRPRDPYVESASRIWFVGQRDNYIATFAPATGKFDRIELPEGTGPHNLIVGSDGTVWYAGNRQGYIGRYTPATGEIRKIMMPDPAARDPHTLVFDGAGNIWFTLQGANMVGRMDLTNEKIDLITIPEARSRPYGIIVDPLGQPWIALFGTNRIATVDPGTMELSEFRLPRKDARPRRLVRTSDGLIWYVDYAEGYLGRLDPDTGAVTEWHAPSGYGAGPYALIVDDRDRLWFVETGPGPNRLVGFDPATEEFFNITDIPSGGGTVRHMVYHEATQSIWFGTDANTIGRAIID